MTQYFGSLNFKWIDIREKTKQLTIEQIISVFDFWSKVISFLFFLGPFNQAITSHMLLKNPTDQPIVFKIKTTAPKRYCVRPNSGILEPNNSLQVGSK